MSGSIWSRLVRSPSKSSSLLLVDGVGDGSFSSLNDMWRASKLLCFRAWNVFRWCSNSSSEDDVVPFSRCSSCFDDLTSNDACFFAWNWLRSRSPSRYARRSWKYLNMGFEKAQQVCDLLTLIKILLCSDRDLVFWKCSRFFLNASSSNLSFSSSSSPNEMCASFKFDFLAIFANSLISSANGFEVSSDSRMGLKVPGFCFCSFGEPEMLSVEVSITTVSRLVEVVEFDNVPSALWLIRL